MSDYTALRIAADGARKRGASATPVDDRAFDVAPYAFQSARDRYEASKSPERRAAEARLRASKKAKDEAWEASMVKASATLAQPAKPAASTTAPKAAAPKPKSGVSEDFKRGVAGARSLERLRIQEVAKVALERGQAAEALNLLAETDFDHVKIIAQLKQTNLLVEAMKARYEIGGAA